MIDKKLIFDLGFHNGDDTAFYLEKGFKVVAVEANHILAKKGTAQFAEAIASKKLTLINKAISDKKSRVDFYLNFNQTNISSLHRSIAESNGLRAKKIKVFTTTLDELCEKFGTPFYIKTDVEGADPEVAKSLFALKIKPQFVSFETSRTFYPDIFSWLYVSGYRKFQLVNQLSNPDRKGYKFGEHSSGPFGPYLPKNKWITFDEVISRYIKYKELRTADSEELALGWLDIHATF